MCALCAIRILSDFGGREFDATSTLVQLIWFLGFLIKIVIFSISL